MKKAVKFVLVLTLIFSFLGLSAQTMLLGQVINFDEEAVANAKVFLDGKDSGVVTNSRGYFALLIPEGTKVITIVSEKYGAMSTPYQGGEKMNFIYMNSRLEPQEEEKVDIGYGEVDKGNTTHSRNDVDIDKKDMTRGFTTVYDLIRGRVKGVRVTDDNKIFIRGRSSINSSNQPLFVVNGIIVPTIDHILPTEVKDIEVLKDASASIYGTRAANGVILITLKD